MDIKKLIKDTLAPLGIPLSFATRKENYFPFMIYNVTSERGVAYEEDEEVVTKYLVTLTIYNKGNYETIKQDVLREMKKSGFRKIDVPACFYMEDLDVYSQPLEFSYYHYS